MKNKKNKITCQVKFKRIIKIKIAVVGRWKFDVMLCWHDELA